MRGICATIAVALAVACAAENLVKNPGFEEVDEAGRPVAWRCSPQVYAIDEQVRHSGRRSLRFHNMDPGRYELCSQQVPLKPGNLYEFSVWVKTEGIRGKDSGATICIEWWGKDHKYLGGSYPRGVKGDTDWTRVRGIGGRVPPDAVSCNITVYVRKGMVGTAWFDDVELKRAFADPLDTVLVQPNYRGWLWPDQTPVATVDAHIDTRDLDLSTAELALYMQVKDRAGRVWAETTAYPTSPSFRSSVALPRQIPPGRYRLAVRLVERATGRVLASESHRLVRLSPDAPRPRVYIDPHNRVVVDGKPFFPLGTYWNTGLMKEDIIKLYADSPFNCFMPYGLPSRDQLDLAHKYGLKVIYSIKDLYAGTRWAPKDIKSPEDERPAVEKIVREFRDHPALLAWYLNDELPLSMLERLEAHQRWVEELDPNHPTWVVLYQVRQVRHYITTFDAIGTDPYPIPTHPSRAAQWTRLTVDGVCAARPVWMVPQIFNWNCYRKDRKGRTPTFEEMRSMAWQCICEGATGLVFYSFFDIRRDPTTPFDVQWRRVKQMAEEIKKWVPVLLSVDEPPSLQARGNNVHYTVRRAGRRVVLFAVNDDYDPHTITFRLPEGWSAMRRLSDGHVLRPSPKPLVKDRLRGLDMQVYELVK